MRLSWIWIWQATFSRFKSKDFLRQKNWRKALNLQKLTKIRTCKSWAAIVIIFRKMKKLRPKIRKLLRPWRVTDLKTWAICWSQIGSKSRKTLFQKENIQILIPTLTPKLVKKVVKSWIVEIITSKFWMS